MEVIFMLVKAQDKTHCDQLFSMYASGNARVISLICCDRGKILNSVPSPHQRLCKCQVMPWVSVTQLQSRHPPSCDRYLVTVTVCPPPLGDRAGEC